jgi:long-chain acyl-CoA synthetase
VQAIPADVSSLGLGLSASDRQEIVARATSVVHCAGAIAFDMSLEQARNTNERGTERMLALARELSAAGRLRRMVHVSTAYVCGRWPGRFAEQDVAGTTFRNTYERSKAHAETILRTSGGDLPLVVARPSIIVGDSRTGWTPNFNVVYWPLQALSRRLIRQVPADPDGVVDIVPIDYVADGILALHQHDDARPVPGTVHLVAGQKAVSNRLLLNLACEHFGLATPEFARRADLPGVREADLYLPYFDVHTHFDDDRSRSLLAAHGISCPSLGSYFSTLMSYAEHARWGKLSYTRQSAVSACPEENRAPRPGSEAHPPQSPGRGQVATSHR